MENNKNATIKEDVKLNIKREFKVTYRSFKELNEAFKEKHLK